MNSFKMFGKYTSFSSYDVATKSMVKSSSPQGWGDLIIFTQWTGDERWVAMTSFWVSFSYFIGISSIGSYSILNNHGYYEILTLLFSTCFLLQIESTQWNKHKQDHWHTQKPISVDSHQSLENPLRLDRIVLLERILWRGEIVKVVMIFPPDWWSYQILL